MLMNIWVKDKSSGKVHQVGTDVHDSLEVIDGVIIYRNLQNGEISGGDYEFVDAPDSDEFVSVTPDQLMLNRELVHKEVLDLITKSADDSAESEGEAGLNTYDVTVTRTGGVIVKAETEEKAIEIVNSMSAAEIDVHGTLTGWETSDAQLLSEKRKETYYNTKEKGGIVAYESDIAEINVITDGDKRDNLEYIGTFSTYGDNRKYMFFHSKGRKCNYAVEVSKRKCKDGVKLL